MLQFWQGPRVAIALVLSACTGVVGSDDPAHDDHGSDSPGGDNQNTGNIAGSDKQDAGNIAMDAGARGGGGAGGIDSNSAGTGGTAVPGRDAAGLDVGTPPVPQGEIQTIVAVGYGNFRIRSLDGGKTWIDAISTRDAPTSEDKGDILRDVTFGNGVFVAVGSTVYTSRDGKTWEDRGNPVDTWMGGVSFGNGIFVTGGWGGRYAYSSDGMTWTRSQMGTTNIRSAAGGGGLLAMAGDDSAVMVSTDAKTWKRLAGLNAIQVAYCRDAFRDKADCRPAFGHGVYLMPDGAAIKRSLDGAKWDTVYSGKNNFYWVGSVFAFGTSKKAP